MKKWMLQPCRHCNGGALGALRALRHGEPSPGPVVHVPGEGGLSLCRHEGRLPVVRQADRGLLEIPVRGAQEKEAEEMIAELATECRRQGYESAKDELRRLLGKVPEQQWVGVVAAWLHEGEDDDRG